MSARTPARTPPTGGLIAFLNARLNEDEVAALAAKRNSYPAGRRYRGEVPALNGWWAGDMGDSVRPISLAEGEHAARHAPARVLREIEAGRLLIESYRDRAKWVREFRAPDTDYENVTEALIAAIQFRAAVYSDHPDYRPEWMAS